MLRGRLLGSTTLITNDSGEVVQRVEYLPTGETFIEQQDTSWVSPYKFNGKELDEETGLYYYGARYYDPRLSMWLGTDPMQGKYPGISTYAFCMGNPVKYLDSDGREIGDYYTISGFYLGSDGKNDKKVYVAERVKERDGHIVSAQNAMELKMTSDELMREAATIYGESSVGYNIIAPLEMYAIASVHQRNSIAYGNRSKAAQLFLKTDNEDRNLGMQIAIGAAINAQVGGFDYSYGANQWDGAEQAMVPHRDMNKASNGRFMYKMNVMGWYMQIPHYDSWKRSINKRFGIGSFTVPSQKAALYNYRGMKNKGQIRLYSTSQYGLTIFWKEK